MKGDIETGYIKLFRKFANWEWYKDSNVKSLFMHLLLIANNKDNKWQGQTIKRGQLITSINHLSNDTGLSVQQVRTSIKSLKSTHEITSKSTNKYTLITIVNYGLYQTSELKLTSNSTSNLTNEQQTNNKQITTNKNIKNIKNIKSIYNNLTTTTIYNYIESNFDRTLSPIEIEFVSEWLKYYDPDVIGYAICLSCLNNKKNFAYTKGILANWKSKGYKTLEQIKINENNPKTKNSISPEKIFDYDWLDDEED